MKKGCCHIDGKVCTINFCGGSERVCGTCSINSPLHGRPMCQGDSLISCDFEKGLVPYWREGMYDQLLWSIKDSLWNIFNMVNKSVTYWTTETCKNVTGPQNTFCGVWNLKILETRFHFWFFWKYFKVAHGISVQNGSDAFPNELTRFRIEATPIWENIQKHYKNAVII